MQFNLTFEGNLADDPEMRFTPAGTALCKLRVGHNTRRRNNAGEWVNGPTMWVTVTAWAELAERCAELSKGDTVIIEARDDLSVWPYLNQANQKPAGQLQVTAANVSVSMRFKSAQVVRANEPATGFDDPWNTATGSDNARELEPAF